MAYDEQKAHLPSKVDRCVESGPEAVSFASLPFPSRHLGSSGGVLPGLFPGSVPFASFLRLPNARLLSTSTSAATPNGQAIYVRADEPRCERVGAKRGQHHGRSHVWRHGLQFSIPMFNLKRPPIRAKTPYLTLGSAASPLLCSLYSVPVPTDVTWPWPLR